MKGTASGELSRIAEFHDLSSLCIQSQILLTLITTSTVTRGIMTGTRGTEFRTWVPDAAKAYACWLSAPLILVIEA